MTQADAPIGVFDSGVGGLTVLHELRRAFPGEDFVYLGDTARVPYGTKSPDTVARYAANVAGLLRDRGCKAYVIACNTASAYGLDAVQEVVSGPVIDVIGPVAQAVSRLSRGGRVGVLGTRGTVSSGSYLRALADGGRSLHVVQQACPLFVPLAEEGWVSGDVPRQVADTYLAELLAAHALDSLILGCTHYPLLRAEIAGAVERHSPTEVSIHESGPHAAAWLRTSLGDAGLVRDRAAGGRTTYLVSDDPEGFRAVGRRFLGEAIDEAEHVHVG